MLWTHRPGEPVSSTVYEANGHRAGGRCWTLRNFFAGGLITEHGGAFLNSDKMAVRRLAASLGLREEVVSGGDLPSGEEIFFIDGRLYIYAEANADWHNVGFPRSGPPRSRCEARPRRCGLTECRCRSGWSTEIGVGSRFGKLMLANTVTENGCDPSDQSALDLSDY